MIRFLLKGILHDRSRSLLPIIVVSIGVMLTVVCFCWINGIMGESMVMTANFSNGHIKVMTRAYAEEAAQMPNDLAIMGIDTLLKKLKTESPDMDWVSRIRFAALADFPDAKGETRVQGPVVGWGIDLFSPGSKEKIRFNLNEAIVTGVLPSKPSEALISHDFAMKSGIKTGDRFTLFGTTMDGSMALKNFLVCGTVRFGSSALDRGAVIIDLTDAQAALAMNNAASEILGYFKDGPYDDERARIITHEFNARYATVEDEFAPQMITFRDQEGIAELMAYAGFIGKIMVIIFVVAMSVVLWNAGLIGCLRRYNEFGVRLALGEGKNHIYQTLIYEGILIGLTGTIIGTIIGLALSYLLQSFGLNISGMMKNSTMLIPSVARTQVTSTAYYIGIIPGLFSTVFGSLLAGAGIYKRKTAQLFKELEV